MVFRIEKREWFLTVVAGFALRIGNPSGAAIHLYTAEIEPRLGNTEHFAGRGGRGGRGGIRKGRVIRLTGRASRHPADTHGLTPLWSPDWNSTGLAEV